MPPYELTLITRVFPRPEALKLMKRIVDSYLWKNKAIIREVEFLGTRTFPFKFVRHDTYFWKGMHWLIVFDAPAKPTKEYRAEFQRDLDVLKAITLPLKPNEESIRDKYECLIEEESLPPPYRKDVAALIEHGKRPNPSRQL